jgi:hypothetical protein
MNRFDLFRTFRIPSEVFFRFIARMRKTYRNVPYHNWSHACDTMQYLCSELVTAELDKVYTAFEIFSLLLASLCHDSDDPGFHHTDDDMSAVPLEILFPGHSPSEVHHCTVTILVMSREDCNLMVNMSPDDRRPVWNWLLKLILSTDMSQHFRRLDEAKRLLSDNKFSLEDPEHRFLSMELLLKAANISMISRPFSQAEKWSDMLFEEFFRQGDIERQKGGGMGWRLNDREICDKQKSQIAFHNFIGIPVFETVAGIFPKLSVNSNSLKSNLEAWKSMVH